MYKNMVEQEPKTSTWTRYPFLRKHLLSLLHQLLPLPAGILTFLMLCWSCTGNWNYYGFMSSVMLSCTENTVSLWSSPISMSYNLYISFSTRVPELWLWWVGSVVVCLRCPTLIFNICLNTNIWTLVF